MIADHDYKQLMNQATVRLTGASDAALRAEFYDVLSEFFNDSSCWTQNVTIYINTTDYDYPLQVNEGQIIRLNSVFNYGVDPPTETVNPQTVTPYPALMMDIGVLHLKATSNSPCYLVANVVTNVALPTDKKQVPQCPDWVLPVWHVGLLDGLLGKMMTHPGKTYTNLAQGAYHLKRFRDAIQRARVSKLRANTIGSSAWSFPGSYRTVTQQGGIPGFGNTNERAF